jgi:GGDEF domain-containing protein
LKFPELETFNFPVAECDGVIMELKAFTIDNVNALDRITKKLKGIPTILVATPASYQVLISSRRGQIDQSLVILSEQKSLDFVIQLPRFIEDVATKRRLRLQNERLQRMLAKTSPAQHFLPSTTAPEPQMVKQVLRVDREAHQGQQCALKISFKNWNRIAKTIGASGRVEVLELISRLIHKSVRNSDRVLRSAEHEFLVLLSNTRSVHLARCKERLERALKALALEKDSRPVRLAFAISSLETYAQHPQ